MLIDFRQSIQRDRCAGERIWIEEVPFHGIPHHVMESIVLPLAVLSEHTYVALRRRLPAHPCTRRPKRSSRAAPKRLRFWPSEVRQNRPGIFTMSLSIMRERQ